MDRKARLRRARSELKNTAYEIFIGLLSVLSILNLVLVWVFRADPSLQTVLSIMNGLFSIIFLLDFTYRIVTAPSASRYFFREFGWADLLASLPFAEVKILRVFRLIRVTRLMRELGVRALLRTLLRDRANSALWTLLLMGILVLEFGSMWMLALEQYAEGSNITTASDAIWYTIVTIATVGYGDTYPVTSAGRLLGAVIIVVGVGIFGTFTGYLANLFLGPSKSEPPVDEDVDAATADAPTPAAPTAAAPTAEADAARLRALLEQSEATNAEIRRLLAQSGA
ncbi:ion transporter [Microbacterium kyungheense]|uniref:Voltage-gated potassium channel n=1 Tax=Microbacterium kyungheense TaxID=1263636 RepID=A0A543EUA3_9MICO|nr:ion transporter [Microbacterium kyungheense]TQM25152.1 voltage-gated potassium channel [Microbacterium kyungheense]